MIAGAIALFGYGISLYITSIGTVLQGDAKVLLATPLSIIAPFFLIVGCLLLFLRIFPWLLHLGAHFAARGRGAVSLLATSVIPELTFTDLNSNLSNDQFFALQSALSTQLVVPPSLPLMLIVLAGIYAIALTMMVRVVSRPAPGQALRLNQD